MVFQIFPSLHLAPDLLEWRVLLPPYSGAVATFGERHLFVIHPSP